MHDAIKYYNNIVYSNICDILCLLFDLTHMFVRGSRQSCPPSSSPHFNLFSSSIIISCPTSIQIQVRIVTFSLTVWSHFYLSAIKGIHIHVCICIYPCSIIYIKSLVNLLNSTISSSNSMRNNSMRNWLLIMCWILIKLL